jgi:hypothetical protein
LLKLLGNLARRNQTEIKENQRSALFFQTEARLIKASWAEDARDTVDVPKSCASLRSTPNHYLASDEPGAVQWGFRTNI